MFELTIIATIATVVIAFAAIQTWLVYKCMSQQIEKQIGQTREQIVLTRDMFLESHRPALSVSIKKCKYCDTTETFEGRITAKNHGTVAAHDIDLTLTFAGGFANNPREKIASVVIQPLNKFTQSFSFSMTRNAYESGQTRGNRHNVLIQGPYKGVANSEYEYHERQEYDPKLKRFVPYWAK
jgi:hypothetical protein